MLRTLYSALSVLYAPKNAGPAVHISAERIHIIGGADAVVFYSIKYNKKTIGPRELLGENPRREPVEDLPKPLFVVGDIVLHSDGEAGRKRPPLEHGDVC